MPHYKLKRRGARPRKCLRVKKSSFEPESNQRPKDCQLATYSPPLYQMSYRRHTGRGQNLNPPEPVTVSQRKNWDPGSETSPLLEENTSLSGLAGKSGRGPQPGLRGRSQQTFPGGLVVRIRRSHRRGPGSIPGQGMSFCPPAAVVIAKFRTTNSSVEEHGQGNVCV
ncbi:unnamed protein product [Leuciscus chuanchicus]